MQNVLSGTWRFHKRSGAEKTNNKVAQSVNAFISYTSFRFVLWIIGNLSVWKIQKATTVCAQGFHSNPHHRLRILCWTQKEKESWQSDVENISVWNGHYYFIQMPLLCLKNLSGSSSANTAHVKRKPRDRRRLKWERRAYAKTACVAAISKERRCGEPGRRATFLVAEPAWAAAAGAPVLWKRRTRGREDVRTWGPEDGLGLDTTGIQFIWTFNCIWPPMNIEISEKSKWNWNEGLPE